ncbi:expressed unknown protein [Seminavis robusta]|uniref:Uncharacterized protein n=1 Tax=Seminavis robusta TaxID=568900 RepID=A0A9N8H4U6_9STRA|nr:expressed unknown protein [Seminavis robusta]CAB9500891.1 expressed unknown protein [Seminavis robusta]|eukprot:Sro94_g049020.1 n/a (411) ;mRNA; f:69182-70414
MTTYCNYDYTNNPDPVPDFLQCLPDLQAVADIEDVRTHGNKLLSVPPGPEGGIIRQFIAAKEKEVEQWTQGVLPRDEFVDEEGPETDDERNDGQKTQRKVLCCTLKSLIASSVFLFCCVVFLIVVVIVRSMRAEPNRLTTSSGFSQRNNATTIAPIATLDEPSSKETERANVTEAQMEDKFLLIEGEACDGHDKCRSGLCGGDAPPYACQSRLKGCRPCYQDRNCLSGLCLIRSGQSICASTVDGRMELGCFCDEDEQCSSQRCEGTCRAPVKWCTLDTDCPYGVCYLGLCTDDDLTSGGNNQLHEQPPGGLCSGDADCISRICVEVAQGEDWICSSGEMGSICGADIDCKSERCYQGICAQKQSSGGPCMGNVECDSGVCMGFSDNNLGVCLDAAEVQRVGNINNRGSV